VVLAAEMLEQRVRDRVGRPPLVDVPGLGPLDVHRVHVVGVEVGAESLTAARRQIQIALDLAAERPLHGIGERREARAQMVDIVGDERGAAAQEILDLVGIRAQHLTAVAPRRGRAVALRRHRLLVEHQDQRFLRPDRRLAEQIVQP
jgi:hypothetical protein